MIRRAFFALVASAPFVAAQEIPEPPSAPVATPAPACQAAPLIGTPNGSPDVPDFGNWFDGPRLESFARIAWFAGEAYASVTVSACATIYPGDIGQHTTCSYSRHVFKDLKIDGAAVKLGERVVGRVVGEWIAFEPHAERVQIKDGRISVSLPLCP